MKKYIFILSITTLLFTISSCVKDGYKTSDQVSYYVEFETNDASIQPDGTMTLYNNFGDTTVVKGIGETLSHGSDDKYSWSDIVNWEKSSGMKINPDNNTKASLYVTFRGKVMNDTKGGFGEEVKFTKVYHKDEFKE